MLVLWPVVDLKSALPELSSSGNRDNSTDGGGTFIGGGVSSEAVGFVLVVVSSAVSQSQDSGAGIASIERVLVLAVVVVVLGASSQAPQASSSPSAVAQALVAFGAGVGLGFGCDFAGAGFLFSYEKSRSCIDDRFGSDLAGIAAPNRSGPLEPDEICGDAWL